jgi:hypothetical protein
VTESYYLLAPETFLSNFVGSYSDHLSAAAADAFTAALAASRIFVAPRLAAVFPLVPIKVAKEYVSEPFFLCAPDGLAAALGADAGAFDNLGDTFPPVGSGMEGVS